MKYLYGVWWRNPHADVAQPGESEASNWSYKRFENYTRALAFHNWMLRSGYDGMMVVILKDDAPWEDDVI